METDRLQDRSLERRYAELRADGRQLSGVVIRYGDVARLPWGRETFESGAFGDVAALDAVLNVQHDRSRPLARTGGGGLVLEDSADALRMRADLPDTRDAADTLTLVRSGVLRGLSMEFGALRERQDGQLRIVQRASLGGFGVVDRPAYKGSEVHARAEIRADGGGLMGSFHYNVNRVVSDRADVEQRQARRRKVRVNPGAFSFAIEDPTREISVTLGRSYAQPLASKLATAQEAWDDYVLAAGFRPRAEPPPRAARLTLTDGPERLDFEIDRLPDTSYVSDFRAELAAGASVFGVDAIFTIPPAETVPDAVSFVVEPESEGGATIEVVNQAVLTQLAVVTRAPRGNPGQVQIRRRWWL